MDIFFKCRTFSFIYISKTILNIYFLGGQSLQRSRYSHKSVVLGQMNKVKIDQKAIMFSLSKNK